MTDCRTADCPNPSGDAAGYCWPCHTARAMTGQSTDETPAERLEYLRGELEAERISYGELAELQGLAEHIDPFDVQLLEWAGVPEFAEDETDVPSAETRQLAAVNACTCDPLPEPPRDDCPEHGLDAEPSASEVRELEAIGMEADAAAAPHYPTSAELAAFRRAIPSGVPHYNGNGRPEVSIHPMSGGAWPDELANGIGYSVRDGMPRGIDGYTSRYDAYYARREANRMRSEDYAAIQVAAMSDPDAADALEARYTFAPATLAELHEGHGGAAGSFRDEGCTLCPSDETVKAARVYPASWDEDARVAGVQHWELHS